MALAPPPGSLAPLNMSELGGLVRSWVYHDTQLNTLNKQASMSRNARDDIEDKILGMLGRANYNQAVIQIAGGRIIVNEERRSQTLTFKSLENMLREYFRQRAGPFQDETGAILKFIKGHRQTEMVRRLKKIMAPVPPTGPMPV